MTLSWGQMVVLGVAAFALCALIFGYALIAYDELGDPDLGRQFDDDLDLDPVGTDADTWADVLDLRHHTDGPDRAA